MASTPFGGTHVVIARVGVGRVMACVAADLRHQLALAVAAPAAAAYRLDADNRRLGPPLALDRAVAADVSFYVAVGPEILAVDFDQDDADERAARLYLALRERGLLPVMVSSGGPGRRHIFCRVPLAQAADAVELLGHVAGQARRDIRPPLTRHRRGGRGELLLPGEPEEVLRRLHGAPDRPLTDNTRERIHVVLTDVVDTSDVINSVAWGVANRGWSDQEFELLLQTPGTSVHALYVDRADRRGEEVTATWMRKYVWDAAVAGVASHPAHGKSAAPLLTSLLQFEDSTTWSGRGGPARRAVLLALVKCYARCGVLPFNASLRTLAEMAGLGSRNTVTKALAELEDSKFIERMSGIRTSTRTDSGIADAWRFGSAVPAVASHDSADTLALDQLGHDLFHHRELGKTAQLVYDRLHRAPGTAVVLAERTGVSVRATRTALRQLRCVGLVQETGEGQWTVSEMTPDDVASLSGTTGRSDAQRQRHRRERRQYQQRGDA